jgi:hypothetical protein
MFRRCLRISSLIPLPLILAIATFGQYRWAAISYVAFMFSAHASGMTLSYTTARPGFGIRPSFGIVHYAIPRGATLSFDVRDLLTWPMFTNDHGNWQFTLPWWLIFSLAGAVAAFVWRKTRSKYTGKGFPVEPAANPSKP